MWQPVGSVRFRVKHGICPRFTRVASRAVGIGSSIGWGLGSPCSITYIREVIMPDEDTKIPAGFLDNTQAAALGDRLRRVNGKLLFWSTVAFAVAGAQVAGRAKGWANGVSGLEF